MTMTEYDFSNLSNDEFLALKDAVHAEAMVRADIEEIRSGNSGKWYAGFGDDDERGE